MSTLVAEIDTTLTTPSIEDAWPAVFPRSKAHATEIEFGDLASSELKRQSSQSVCLETSWEHLPSSAYEEPWERAYTQRDVWETLKSFLESSAMLLSVGTKIRERLTTEPLNLFRWIDVSKSHFTSEILSAIDAEPVEDGYWHPAEKLLRLSLIDHSSETNLWLRSIISSESNASIVASILKCLGRVELEICNDWGFNLVGTALDHPDVEVRDAAVQVLEIWGTTEAIRLLKKHRSREQVVWLQSYIERVIQDLEGSWELSHGSRC